MNRKAVAHPPYVRSMQGWWRTDPFFMRYMVREATALAVLVYAIVLAAGVICLAQGETAWNAWLAAMQTPWSLLLHLLLLVCMVVHAQSWFEIIPKTMPMLFIGGQRLTEEAITRTGWAVTVLASVALFAIAWWLRP